MPKYVCHSSGQGEKWEVLEQHSPAIPILDEREWLVKAKERVCAWHILPKSEYILCEAPEVWTDVTADCKFKNGALLAHPEEGGHGWSVFDCSKSIFPDQYRMRKMQVNFPAVGVQGERGSTPAHCGWAFVIEKREALR